MKKVVLSLLVGSFVPGIQALAQCLADSVRTYQFVNGNRVLADVEYFGFDEKDSVLFSRLVTHQSGSPVPVFENRAERSREGGNQLIRVTSLSWSPEKGTYLETARSSKRVSKKGQVISEMYEAYAKGVWQWESQIRYTYSKSGLLLEKNFDYWDSGNNRFIPVTRLSFVYSGDRLTETLTSLWDSAGSNWKNDWKLTFEYDSLNYLQQTIMYRFKHSTWIPEMRTQYGREEDKMVRFNLVQKWNGGKENWENETYYVFQLDENDRVKMEIHLTWNLKDWKIDQAVKYVYNEQGELYQVLNENDQVIQERFCR